MLGRSWQKSSIQHFVVGCGNQRSCYCVAVRKTAENVGDRSEAWRCRDMRQCWVEKSWRGSQAVLHKATTGVQAAKRLQQECTAFLRSQLPSENQADAAAAAGELKNARLGTRPEAAAHGRVHLSWRSTLPESHRLEYISTVNRDPPH